MTDLIHPAPHHFTDEEITTDPILHFFHYAHLPPALQASSKPFCDPRPPPHPHPAPKPGADGSAAQADRSQGRRPRNWKIATRLRWPPRISESTRSGLRSKRVNSARLAVMTWTATARCLSAADAAGSVE